MFIIFLRMLLKKSVFKKNKKKCSFDPRKIKGPIGMFHCPECGQMVIAGSEHSEDD